MTRLFWQLPWAGPSRWEGGSATWSVMPSPGMGDARAICIPVVVSANTVELALADATTPIPLVAAPLGTWTAVTGARAAGHTGFLCLVGYDQPAGGAGDAFITTAGVAVQPADLVQALVDLQRDRGDGLVKQVLAKPPTPSGRRLVAGGRRGAGDAQTPLSVTLAFACCQYPAGLMDGLPAERSLQRLADRLDDPDARHPDRLLLVGDQIYADATAGLLDPVRLDDRYRVPYEELLHIEPLRRIMGRIPVLCMLDDHEIVDNWEPYVKGAQGPLFRKGVAAYWTYQRGVAPRDRTWIKRREAGWSLFMADTRTHRDARTEASLLTAEILGSPQHLELEQWLTGQPAENLKLVASPAMLLPRLWEHLEEPLHLDGWQGYPASLQRLLMFVCDNEIANVIFLSGDAHLGCDVTIRLTGPDGKKVALRSIHAPALYAPLPFANEQPWNLKIPDDFEFPGPGGTYTCHVTGAVSEPYRDGYRLLMADRVRGIWEVSAPVH